MTAVKTVAAYGDQAISPTTLFRSYENIGSLWKSNSIHVVICRTGITIINYNVKGHPYNGFHEVISTDYMYIYILVSLIIERTLELYKVQSSRRKKLELIAYVETGINS